MNERAEIEFSLLGGPLHRIGRRLRLVRGPSNSVRLGLAVGVVLWASLILLATARGVGYDLFRIEMIAVHLRLLVIIPLLFLTESLFDPEARVFVRSLVRSEVVPEEERPALLEIIEWFRWRKDALLADVICLIGAFMLGTTRTRLTHASAWDPTSPAVRDEVLLTFYFAVVLTMFRFLVFRWLWRLLLWARFLWRLSRLRLRLIAGHSDRAAGLGGLEIVQYQLIPLVVAISILNAGTFVPEFRAGLPFVAVYSAAALGAMFALLIIFGPMFVFTPKLVECRYRGFYRYMALATRYVKEFEDRWLSGKPSETELLGAADLQSLADLTNSIDVVREMRVVPAGLRLLWVTLAAAIVPMLPLGLFQYSLTDLLQKSVTRLLGG